MEKSRLVIIYNIHMQKHVQISFEISEYTSGNDMSGTWRLLDLSPEMQNHACFYLGLLGIERRP